MRVENVLDLSQQRFCDESEEMENISKISICAIIEIWNF